MDLFLCGTRVAASLAYVLHINLFWNQSENFGRDQIVVKNHISDLEQARRFQGEKLRVAWAGAYQIDLSVCHKLRGPSFPCTPREAGPVPCCDASIWSTTACRERNYAMD